MINLDSYDIEVFPDVHMKIRQDSLQIIHAVVRRCFVFPERNGKYYRASAERHWYRILSLFERKLKTMAKK